MACLDNAIVRRTCGKSPLFVAEKLKIFRRSIDVKLAFIDQFYLRIVPAFMHRIRIKVLRIKARKIMPVLTFGHRVPFDLRTPATPSPNFRNWKSGANGEVRAGFCSTSSFLSRARLLLHHHISESRNLGLTARCSGNSDKKSAPFCLGLSFARRNTPSTPQSSHSETRFGGVTARGASKSAYN